MRYLLLPLLLAGCVGAVQIGPAAPDPDPTIIGQGVDPANEITIYRAAYFGLATSVAANPALVLDGRSVGTCRIGAPLVLRVPDGDYEIAAVTPAGTVTQTVSVSNGSQIFIRCGTGSAPAPAPVPVLETVTAETADREAGI
ncbi:MAG: hypothetical protein QNJ35_11180 [Paracoccaceae bacterium]|nr:hypothetical protein [Paracoccaceae bacterium]